MKKLLIILIMLFPVISTGQSIEEVIAELKLYSNNINEQIKNSTGLAGDIFSNTISTQRNVRAIGMQYTRITYYYFQKDDSIYESSNETIFIPRYNPPSKIRIEYNIALQSVTIDYFINNKNSYYKYTSSGEYGFTEIHMFYKNNELLKYMKYTKENSLPEIDRTEKFSKEEYNEGLLAIDRQREYEKMYYDLFRVEQLDK